MLPTSTPDEQDPGTGREIPKHYKDTQEYVFDHVFAYLEGEIDRAYLQELDASGVRRVEDKVRKLANRLGVRR